MDLIVSKPKSWVASSLAIVLGFATAGGPALAQDSRDEEAQQGTTVQRRPVEAPIGQTARSTVGQVGQRQKRDEAASTANPMQRLATRIQNRVQNRVRNRIDRYYDARPDATSSFRVAENEAQRQRVARRR